MNPEQTGTIHGFERVLATLVTFLFFLVGYLWAGSGHAPETAWYPVTRLDHQIPLVPVFILFYMLGYVFVLAPVLFLRQRRDFEAALTVMIGMLALAFLCFQFFPVILYKQYATGTDFLSELTLYQQKMDSEYNNLPSLHVALNLFAWTLFLSRARTAALWWLPLPVCVVLSTLLVKQHLIADVIGGMALAATGFAAWVWLHQRPVTRVTYALALLLAIGVILANLPRVWTGGRIVTDLLKQLVGV